MPSTITEFALADDSAATIRQAAALAGITPGQWLRQAITTQARAQFNPDPGNGLSHAAFAARIRAALDAATWVGSQIGLTRLAELTALPEKQLRDHLARHHIHPIGHLFPVINTDVLRAVVDTEQ